jgi:phenylalanine-4-hydroxylase
MAVAPVTYGASTRPPRGNYASAADDYTCPQHWNRYTAAEHALYARLHQRQSRQMPGQACEEFIHALAQLGNAEQIPDFDEVSERLRRATRWEIVAVPGLIPEHAFFSLLAARRFPVTVWLRQPEEFDYIVEPDAFHDLFGHVPLLFNPVFADYMQAFGAGGLKAEGLAALRYLARLYWYTVEFGLIETAEGLRILGAGIVSSASESRFCLESPSPHRVGFDLERVMRTPYRIDDFQQIYFVIPSLQALLDATLADFSAHYERLARLPDLPIAEVQASDRVFTVGDQA